MIDKPVYSKPTLTDVAMPPDNVIERSDIANQLEFKFVQVITLCRVK